MSTSFIIAPSSGSRSTGSSSTLNLLPFSLGSNSKPYRSTTTNVSSYFKPRPLASDPSSSSTGLFASFRGRAIVGQSVEVPRGYKGVILSTTPRPDHGGLEDRRQNTARSAQPLTPASSVAESSIAVAEEGGARRSTRQKGAGQVALAKPRTRVAPRRSTVKKRIRLDSDDEDEGEEKNEMEEESARLGRTPSKRQKRDVPSITVQGPTPKKRGLANAPTEVDLSTDETDEVKDLNEASAVLQQVKEEQPGEVEEAMEQEVRESIVPSPATEDGPPTFSITPQASTDKTETKVEIEDSAQEANAFDGAVRVLRPSATFSEIMLWTPDGPLPGFRADELETRENEVTSKSSSEIGNPRPDSIDMSGVKEEETASAVRKGWWRVGGAGEGGDEFVRAMGEWLGMVEMIHEPVYLTDLPDDDDAEDE